MITLFNVRGYTGDDPLDRVPAWFRYGFSAVTTFGVCAAYLTVVFDVLDIATLHPDWLRWVEYTIAALFFSPVVVALRKASSFVPMALLLASAIPIDIALEAQVRMKGGTAPWVYNSTGLLGPLHPLLQIVVAWVGDAVMMAPVCLFVSRLLVAPLAKAFFANFARPAPTAAQQAEAFPKNLEEDVAKPRRDMSFYVLRIVGLLYLGYLLFAAVGLLGTAPWPTEARDVLLQTYANPALTVNTIIKISIMVNLAFIGAYNPSLRFHTSLVLLVGHLISTVASLGFYLFVEGASHKQFLLTSAAFDGLMGVFFIWNMVRHRDLAGRFAKLREFPEYFSLPQRLTILFYRFFAVACAAIVVGVVAFRFLADGSAGWGAIYGFPDPQVCNTLTKYGTLGFLAWLIADREELREDLLAVILYGYAISVVTSLACLLGGGWLWDASVQTRTGGVTSVDWYFALNIGMDGLVVGTVMFLRKMFYDVDYGIATLGPSTAHNVMSLHEALYRGDAEHPVDAEDHAAAARSVDRHVAGVRGRKRGLLNAPFWFVEHALGLICWLRPAFSSMGPEERRFVLRKHVLRPPSERARAIVPPLAEAIYKLGTAIHAFVTLAQYSGRKGRSAIGYVAPGARARLQASHAADPPTAGAAEASLPRGPDDPANFIPADPAQAERLIAPGVVTQRSEPSIPREVDYLVVGSGAGGAVAAYRLASAVQDASRILIVERGPRFSPLTDFSDDEMEMVRRLYKEGGIQQTKRFGLTILQGECVGGSTVINNACCVEMPATIRQSWEENFGLDLAAIDDEYARIADELEIRPIAGAAVNPKVAEKFLNAVRAYNDQHPQSLLTSVPLKSNHRNVLGSGLDNIGDRQMRKRSMLETYLPWAEGRGAKILSETTAVAISFRPGSGGKRIADSVLLRGNMGQLSVVKVNKAVILAGGVVASSHVLMRSGLTGNVGRNVACNFALPSVLEFGETLDAFDGLQITLGATDADSKAIFETYFNPPGAFAIATPFYFTGLTKLMGEYRRLMNIGALVASEPNGVIERTPDWLDGRPVSWTIGTRDEAHLKFALNTLVDLAAAAGANKVILPTEPGLSLCTADDRTRFKRAMEQYPLRMEDLRLVTSHPQGGNRMASASSKERDTRVVDEDYRVSGLENVFVADASVFPTGITVNPQWTIMALASLAAESILNQGESGRMASGTKKIGSPPAAATPPVSAAVR